MAAAIEAINGLTSATEAATAISKITSGFLSTIGSVLSLMVNSILQPLGSVFVWLLSQLLNALIIFKKWWDGLPGWIDEKVIKPIAEWIDKYIVKPFWKFFEDVNKWIDTYIVKPFWKFFDDVSKWINTYIVKPFWKFFEDVSIWVDTYIVKPFWKALDDIQTWVNLYITTPFWNTIYGIQMWVDAYITTPFWNAISDIKAWVKTYIEDPWNGFLLKFSWESLLTTFKSFINRAIDFTNAAIKLMPFGVGYLVPTIPHVGQSSSPTSGADRTSSADISRSNTLNFYGYQDDKFIQKVKDVLRSQGTVYNL